MLRYLLLCLFLLGFSGHASAMSCRMPDNTIEAYPVIFKGVALKTDTLEEKLTPEDEIHKAELGKEGWAIWAGKPQVTHFRVIESYKGGIGKEIDIFHRSRSIFGAEYDRDVAYVVYARKDEQGHLGATQSCSPGGSVDKLDKNDKQFAQLEVFSQQARLFRKLVSENPDNLTFYREQGAFHEKYADYVVAEQAYKTADKKFRAGTPYKGEGFPFLTFSTSSFHSTPFSTDIGRVLYRQEKFEEALPMLQAAMTHDEKQFYIVSLIKLKRFDDLKVLKMDLSGIKLEKLDLSHAELDGLDLSGATIQELALDRTTLTEANFSKAKLLYSLSIENSTLKNADFRGAELSGGSIEKSDLSGSDFTGAKLYMQSVDGVRFDKADFWHAVFTVYHIFTDTHFDGAELAGLDFSGEQFDRDIDGMGKFSDVSFKNARYDDTTRWFPNFDPVKVGAKKTFNGSK